MMSATRSSLLSRIRDLDDRVGWGEFDQIYRPMLAGYARRRGLDGETADEIAQRCMVAIVGQIQRFKRQKSFRGWLRKMVDHKVASYFADKRRCGQAKDHELSDAPDRQPTPAALWHEQWNAAHVRYIVRGLQEELAEHTLRAFELYVLHEYPVEEISRMLGMTANQIYVAKSRVLQRLREQRFAELLSALYEEGP